MEKPRQVGRETSRAVGMANRLALARDAPGWHHSGQRKEPLRSSFRRMVGKAQEATGGQIVGVWGGWSADLDSVGEVWWEWRPERSLGLPLTNCADTVPPGV